MKIIYIANMRVPTEKAHGLATVKLCEAFANAGVEVELVVPWAVNRIKKDPFEFYKARKNFKIRKFPAIDLLFLPASGGLSRLFFLLRSFSFSLFALVYFFFLKFFSKAKNVVFFSHDHIPLYFMSFLGIPFILDVHDFPTSNIFYRRVFKKAKGFVVQTKWKINELNKRFGVSKDKIVYWPNGVEIDEFDIDISQEDARKKLDLPLDPEKNGASKKIILYTGNFFKWKGVDTFALASKYLDDETGVYFVGGSPKETKEFKSFISKNKLLRIELTGFRPHEEIPLWLKAADVLVLPNTAKEDISKFYTSPMKLFEYMVAGRPIVASDTPSITEILYDNRSGNTQIDSQINAENQRKSASTEKDPRASAQYGNAVLVKPDNPESLADGIKRVLSDKSLADRISKQARRDVEKYTWTERAERIKKFILQLS